MEHFNKWRFRSFEIPAYMRDSVEDYIQLGIKPGSFLSAVIRNDLKQAVMYADDQNIGQLPAYANYFYNSAPLECWGSVDKMNSWIEKGGLIGIRNSKQKRA